MAEGWENARRRDAGHDYVIVALAAAGRLRHVEIDTSCFIGNAPDRVRLMALDEPSEQGERGERGVRGERGERGERGVRGERGERGGRDPGFVDPAWREVLPLTRVQPDTRHRFRLDDGGVATHVRLDVVPDGGLARLRIHGEIIPEALAGLRRRWHDALPQEQR